MSNWLTAPLGATGRDKPSDAARVRILNSSGEAIPGRSFVKVTGGGVNAKGQSYLVVGKPTATAGDVHLVTDLTEIADGAEGVAFDPSHAVWVKHATAPTPVEEVGPASGSWESAATGTGFDALRVDSTNGLTLVRSRGSAASSGGSSGGGGLATNNCCDTIYQAGSVDLDGLEWATDYTITLASPIGTVTVTDQGSGTWESDAIDVTCTVDEVEVTDEYTVTMTATGNAPGEVVVTVALTLGGGYGGAAGCCATTEGGFAWKYVNCCIVDPLAGWSMTRDPSGFSGKECEIGGCEICVTPTLGTRTASTCGGESIQMPLEYYVKISGVTANSLHVNDDGKGVCEECDRLNATHVTEYNTTDGSGFTAHRYRKDFASTPDACDYSSNIQLIFLCDTDPERWHVQVSVSGAIGNDRRFLKTYATRAEWVTAITTPGEITCTCAAQQADTGFPCQQNNDDRNCDYPESVTVIVPPFTP